MPFDAVTVHGSDCIQFLARDSSKPGIVHINVYVHKRVCVCVCVCVCVHTRAHTHTHRAEHGPTNRGVMVSGVDFCLCLIPPPGAFLFYFLKKQWEFWSAVSTSVFASYPELNTNLTLNLCLCLIP